MNVRRTFAARTARILMAAFLAHATQDLNLAVTR